jgi:Zn-dependent protease/predicted transcriptional regulator
MFGSRWQLCRIFGIPFYIDLSWLIILLLITWTLTDMFGRELPQQPSATYLAMALSAALSFFACIVLHEMGHALVGKAVGMRVKGITLFLFGGVAELGSEPNSARSEFLMAIAGPIVSLVLAGLFWLGSALGAQASWPLAVVLVLDYLALINLTVLVFNMIPAFPLDGGRVLRSILWGATGNLPRATYWAALLGQLFAWVLILGGVWLFFAGQYVQGMWMGLIGLFLKNAAQGSYQQVLIRQALQDEPVRRFMNPQPIVVDPGLDLQTWVDDYVYRHHRKSFPVAANGNLQGLVSTHVLSRIPREEWSRHTVGEIMQRDLDGISIASDADAMAALRKMERTGSSRLLVIDNGRLAGIISLKDLLHFLQFKLGLEEAE